MSNFFINYKRDKNIFFYPFILLGLSLSVAQLLINRSLWLDESMLALNIISKNFSELLQPLDWKQVAPIGFLWTIKSITSFFGIEELALRSFPFIAYMTSIPYLYLVSKKITKDKSLSIAVVSFFCLTPSMLYYSSELKQYTTDVLFFLIIYYHGIKYIEDKNSSIYLFSILGIAAIWYSNIAIIPLSTIGLTIIYDHTIGSTHKKPISPLAIPALLFIIYYFSFMHNHPTKAYMQEYWKDSFLPFPMFSQEFYQFTKLSIIDICGNLMSFGTKWWAPALFILIGIFSLMFNRKHKQLYYLLFPLLLHLSLSALQLYPFNGRLILYLTPSIIIFFFHWSLSFWKKN